MVRLLVLTLSIFIVLGCSRPMDEKSHSSISIQVPNALNKVGAMAAIPSDRKACYGVNVTGPNIPTKKGNSCSPVTGIIAGFAEPGATIEAQVPKGKNRVVELLVYLLPSGDTSSCPAFGVAMTTAQTTNTFSVAKVYNIDMLNDVTVVEVTADFPGLTNHIAQQQALPLTCGALADAPNTPGFHVSGGAETATGVGMRMKIRTGRPVGGEMASAGTFPNMIRLVTK